MTYGLGILSTWAWRVKDFQVFFSASCSQKREGSGGTRGGRATNVTLAFLGSAAPKARQRDWAAQLHGLVCCPMGDPLSQKPSLARTQITLEADPGHCLEAEAFGSGGSSC